MISPEDMGYQPGSMPIIGVRKYWIVPVKSGVNALLIMKLRKNKGYEIWENVPTGTGDRYLLNNYKAHGPFSSFHTAAVAAKILNSTGAIKL